MTDSLITPETGTLFAAERQQSILERLHRAGKITVEELTVAFGVSAPTIRNDLARLEEQGHLKRTHGGAIALQRTLFEPAYAQRLVMRHEEKRAIARAAAAMVRDGETVLLDAGTTTYEMALLLKERRDLTVVTNSIANAQALMENGALDVILVGGSLQVRRQAILGPLAVKFLEPFRVDRAFLAFNGIDSKLGFTVVDFDAAEIKQRMMACARETVVVADSSKIGQTAFASAAPLTHARLLITDAGIADADRLLLEENGLPVKIAPPK